jgi:G3E family GTPase
MGLNKQPVDGKQTLEQQEMALTFMEQISFAKAISYSKIPAVQPANLTVNEAVLDDVPIGQQPPALHLEAVDANGDPAAVIAKHLAQGQNIIFHDTAFVEGAEMTVLGFR